MVVPKAKKGENKAKLSVKDNGAILKLFSSKSKTSPKSKRSVKVSVRDIVVINVVN